jgi:hypothetical protein
VEGRNANYRNRIEPKQCDRSGVAVVSGAGRHVTSAGRSPIHIRAFSPPPRPKVLMSLLGRLFGRKPSPSQSDSSSGRIGYRVLELSGEEVHRQADEMGEMYYDCPNCGQAERINNMGKMMLKANAEAFCAMTCRKCGQLFDAGPRVKFGKCPGFDYSQL